MFLSNKKRGGNIQIEFFWNVDMKDRVNLDSSVLFVGLITYTGP